MAEQAKTLTHPDPPKTEEDFAEHVDMRLRRFEARSDEVKLTMVFKISALRMLMSGKAKECFDIWEADRDTTDASKAKGELLSKATDYASRNKCFSLREFRLVS